MVSCETKKILLKYPGGAYPTQAALTTYIGLSDPTFRSENGE